ncbi:outer membrane assembly protein AsmA [Atlantibacter subterraneus]|uniref:outer membrane assembly protein AsmA n=1 Tax=Atlantibacter subterraneus TaxID=255519 RepID=UPI0029640C16|nr:outer membrane assembly protein AsmA [Atlantibacter subterranea]MDW2742102.1 outer membrane assembly protein AsmA [Atlantibacter subterranea]
MRRLLTTLMILLVVIIAGLSALVLLVNPNDFRDYMVRQVEARSGYQLKLEGPLRWHVWPQLSILSGRMKLTAPGASQPMVTADNMRLDVKLLPLLSHQLHVRQVMLKGAVVQLTPESEARRPKDAPIGPQGGATPPDTERGWSFDISRLKVADSVLVFQHEGDEQVTVRNLNLQMEQDEKRQAQIDFSARVLRDQRTLDLSFNAALNAADYPDNLTASITNLQYQLRGADLPRQGITGQGVFNANWQEGQKKLSFSELQLTANDSQLSGDGSVMLQKQPDWLLNLAFNKLNLENLLPTQAPSTTPVAQQAQSQPVLPRPVIADNASEQDYSALRGFNARANISAESVLWRGLNFTKVRAALANNSGLLTISTLDGNLGAGHISLPGSLNTKQQPAQVKFTPTIQNIEISQVLKAFDYPIALSGALSMTGDFSGAQIDANAFRQNWQGKASVEMTNSRLEGMNFQQMIQQAVARNNGSVQAQQFEENATKLEQFTTDVSLDHGKLTLNKMEGRSSMLALNGEGTMDLVTEQCDTLFQVRVVDGWKGEGSLVEFLRQTPIPLRVYGSWKQLNYSLQVDQVLRKHLQEEAKRRLNDWAERHKDSSKSKDVKELLKKL